MRNTYIVQNEILSLACTNQYYLKLNRAAQSLEVYEQADNNLLRELYLLQEELDWLVTNIPKESIIEM